MLRNMFTVGVLTLVSRVLGFVRDKLIATHLGSGAMSDVWVAAFQLPNLFRRVFGEGAFNAAFVPMYSRRLEEGGEKEADAFARRTLSLMFMILMGCFVFSFIFMEPIIKLTNLGFATDGRLEPAVAASRITVVYLVFICLVAGLSGILNSRKIFGAPAFAYVVLNVCFSDRSCRYRTAHRRAAPCALLVCCRGRGAAARGRADFVPPERRRSASPSAVVSTTTPNASRC